MSAEYYKTKASVDEYISMAEGHSGKELIAKFKEFLDKGSSVLELGTGPGTDWKILNEDFNVIGSDFSIEFLKRLKASAASGKFLELDATTISTDLEFDGVYSNKVLHHLSDEALADSIKRQWEILNPQGVICHSFWYGEGDEIFKGMFVNYHNEAELKKYFGEYFHILCMETYPEFEDDDSILLIGRKRS